MDELKREELRSNGMPGKCDYQKNRACLDLVTLLLTSVLSRLGVCAHCMLCNTCWVGIELAEARGVQQKDLSKGIVEVHKAFRSGGKSWSLLSNRHRNSYGKFNYFGPHIFQLYICYTKSLQSCPTLCDPMDGSPPGFPVPWDSPGKNTGVGCHFLLQCMKVKSESEVAQSCPTLSDPMDCSPPSSSVHGIFHIVT